LFIFVYALLPGFTGQLLAATGLLFFESQAVLNFQVGFQVSCKLLGFWSMWQVSVSGASSCSLLREEN